MASWWIGKKFKCIPVPNSIQISIKPGILWNTNKIILTTSLSSVLIRVRLLLAEEWQTRILSLASSTLHGINGWIVFEIALLLSVAITVLVLILSTRYLNKYGKSSLVSLQCKNAPSDSVEPHCFVLLSLVQLLS